MKRSKPKPAPKSVPSILVWEELSNERGMEVQRVRIDEGYLYRATFQGGVSMVFVPGAVNTVRTRRK